MKYVIVGLDAPGSLAKRGGVREAHLERLKVLDNEGRLFTAGPMPAVDSQEVTAAGVAGSVIIAEFDTLAAAKEWANNDPYVGVGVYREVLVHPFIQVLPTDS